MTAHKAQSGFTVVELLITLFVAVAFLVSGYQLYNVIIKDGGQTRGESRASNLAYDYLRRYTSAATDPCAGSTPVSGATPTVAGLSAVSVTVTISCPYTNNNAISKVEAVVTYNTPQETVRYATYTTGVGYDGTGVSPTGLVGWWKFNGNANTTVGTANGVVTGATLTVGQTGQANTAYTFSPTCCQYINTSTLPILPATLSISAWIYPTAYPSERGAIVTNSNSTDGYYLSLNSDGSLQSYWYGTSSPGYHTTSPNSVPLNQWTFVTVTWSGAEVKLYLNGALQTTVATSGGGSAAAVLNIGAQTSNQRQFGGKIDDIRMYSRVLNALEISNLNAEGAQ